MDFYKDFKNRQFHIKIITLLYGNNNFGGTLQAYSLETWINSNDFSASQLLYSNRIDNSSIKTAFIKFNFLKKYGYYETVKKAFLFCCRNVKKYTLHILYNVTDHIKYRIDKFQDFKKNNINHTTKVYNNVNIKTVDADIFITGSDQVWNPTYSTEDKKLNPAYWLTFVNNKKKIAYAASPLLTTYDKSQYQDICDALSDFNAISVREKNALHSLKDILLSDKQKRESTSRLAKQIVNVLDPVFLLDKTEWYKICDKNPYKEKKYVFAYILGFDKKDRNFIKEFCKANGYILITTPHILGQFRMCDHKFADIDVYDGPKMFLSLIKDAQYIFTDSFHATAFSLIFHKKFFSFRRVSKGYPANNDRITDILEVAGAEDRFIDCQQDFNNDINEKLINLQLDYDSIQKCLDVEIKKSKDFLLDAIEN